MISLWAFCAFMKHKKNKLAPGHSLSIVSAPVSRVYIYMQSLSEALTQSAGDNNQPYQSCRHLSNNKKPASAVATFQNRTECNVATGICGSSSSSAPTHTHTHTHTHLGLQGGDGVLQLPLELCRQQAFDPHLAVLPHCRHLVGVGGEERDTPHD